MDVFVILPHSSSHKIFGSGKNPQSILSILSPEFIQTYPNFWHILYKYSATGRHYQGSFEVRKQRPLHRLPHLKTCLQLIGAGREGCDNHDHLHGLSSLHGGFCYLLLEWLENIRAFLTPTDPQVHLFHIFFTPLGQGKDETTWCR